MSRFVTAAMFTGMMLLLTACGGGDDSPTLQAARPVPPLAQKETLIGIASEGAQLQWPDGSTATGGKGQTIAGVECLKNENYHLHSHLTVIHNGLTLRIPRNVGLTGCAYELHTHGSTGVVHIETDREKKFNLGQFAAVWGMPFTRENVANITSREIRFFIVDSATVTEHLGDPASIELTQHRSIIVTIGVTPPELPRYSWPKDL